MLDVDAPEFTGPTGSVSATGHCHAGSTRLRQRPEIADEPIRDLRRAPAPGRHAVNASPQRSERHRSSDSLGRIDAAGRIRRSPEGTEAARADPMRDTLRASPAPAGPERPISKDAA